MSYEITNCDVHEASRTEALLEFTVCVEGGESLCVPMRYNHKKGALYLTDDCPREVEGIGGELEEDEEALSDARERFLLHRDELQDKN